MGKRKTQKNQALFSTSQPGGDENQGKKGDLKGKKTYSLQSKQSSKQEAEFKSDEDTLPKVRIPEKLESALIGLILDEQKKRGTTNDLSKRITSKKLTDVYNSLSHAGFSKNQVESSMSNTIMNGGDLLDALDWLCLNTQNDQLPQGFSETLLKEEERFRPKFDRSLQSETLKLPEASSRTTSKASSKAQDAPSVSGKAQDKKPAMKDWILQYAQEDSSDDDDDDDENENGQVEAEFNPTTRYSELFHQLQGLKDEAAIAKSNNATEKHKELSKKLREMHLEMGSLEKQPDFDKGIKEQLKAGLTEKAKPKRKNIPETEPSGTDDGDEGLGLNLFSQAESEPSRPSTVHVKEEEETRSFEYTRSQWTGKSPKQFLIDWVRKHLPKSGPPKYRKIQVKVNRFKCTAVVDRSKEDQLCATPKILCENVKEAEHVASTLALYHLCRGQAVHQLLPPPYRNLWLEWLDEEKKEKDTAKEKENKPRDQFISKLMKSLKIDGGLSRQDADKKKTGEGQTMDDDDEEDDWEALADKGQLSEISPTASESDRKDKGRNTARDRGNYANARLQDGLARRQASLQFQELLKTRQQLPVFQYREKITSAISDHNVVVIAGETGSGKSTQVPQFILEDCINQGGSNPHVIVTEPRRISATSLAGRVAQEMGEEGMDRRDSFVGYQIRFESRRGPNTRLMYCTTGVVLRQLQASRNLDDVSHLIIDEVHERSVQSDFLMIVIKDILTRRRNLKVVLMSATLDSHKFSSYFNNCPVINIPGRTFPVQSFHLEDVIEMTGYVVDEDSPYTLNAKQLIKEQTARVKITQKGGESTTQTLTWTQEDLSRIDWTDLPADEYSLRTRNAVTRLRLNCINMELICDLLRYLETPPFGDIDGAVLIFLPGLADIQDLYELITTDRQFSNKHKYQVYALHSVLSSKDQTRVFSIPPSGVRKIVLATNIAETGITIPDVVFVIDSGKAKEKRYMENTQMSSLEEVFISKANSKQRAGRAGRVRDGFCFKMFTSQQHSDFRAFAPPELLRVPLEELCLNIMKCGYGEPMEFLAGALDPPMPGAVSRAISLLKEVGACHTDGTTLTPLGHHLSALPVDVRIGKMLLLGAIFGCLEQVAVIAAAMTDKSPFVVPLSKRSEADSAKQHMAIACSDHLTLYKAYKGWRTAKGSGKGPEMSFLNKNFLKKSTLEEIETVKEDLVKLVGSIGFTSSKTGSLGGQQQQQQQSSSQAATDGVLSISSMTSSDDLDPSSIAMVKAVLTAGLYPQVGRVLTSPSVVTDEAKVCLVDTSQGTAHVHPGSVNKFLDATGSWLVYHEKVRLSRVYLRDTTVVQPYALLLFGGAIDVHHTQQIVTVDGWIKFKTVARTGVIFKELRLLLNKMLERKLEDPSTEVSRCDVTKLLKDLIKSEKTFK